MFFNVMIVCFYTSFSLYLWKIELAGRLIPWDVLIHNSAKNQFHEFVKPALESQDLGLFNELYRRVRNKMTQK